MQGSSSPTFMLTLTFTSTSTESKILTSTSKLLFDRDSQQLCLITCSTFLKHCVSFTQSALLCCSYKFNRKQSYPLFPWHSHIRMSLVKEIEYFLKIWGSKDSIYSRLAWYICPPYTLLLLTIIIMNLSHLSYWWLFEPKCNSYDWKCKILHYFHVLLNFKWLSNTSVYLSHLLSILSWQLLFTTQVLTMKKFN